jgi:hypothetical protein
MKHDVYDDATTAANKSRRSGTDARTGSDPSHRNKEEMMRKAQEMGSNSLARPLQFCFNSEEYPRDFRLGAGFCRALPGLGQRF